jgi:two-component sensor histidine kinase
LTRLREGMERWIEVLRAQAVEIAQGSYRPDPSAFQGAPPEILGLNEDLNALARAMAERDRVQQALIHEVHHRVKNNLQIVTSLLNMQASKMRDPAARQALGQTRARMGALALIHRMLYEQTDDGSAGKINIARLMTELCAQLRLMHRDRDDVEFICDASAVAVPLDSAVPLTLLSVEAVTNAYNHAFPEGRTGTVTLHFSVEQGQATLRVCDDGAGFDSSAEFTSMGRQLMVAFAHQLGGTLCIERKEPSGTIVTLGYPVGG